MAKANLLLPDGTTVNIEGTAEEVAILLGRFSAPSEAPKQVAINGAGAEVRRTCGPERARGTTALGTARSEQLRAERLAYPPERRRGRWQRRRTPQLDLAGGGQ